MFDDSALLQSDAADRIGTLLCGKYRLDAVLGVGGMATVYAATHRNQAELAIKILHRELAAEPVVRSRFLHEAYATNSVRHRGVVKVVDDDIADDGSVFLVMERLAGAAVEDLRDRVGGKVGLEAAVGIVERLLDVLAAVHAQGIVHRDVKPANLFVTPEGEVKVLDFGIAWIREAVTHELSLAGAVTLMGTPTYMAPEQTVLGGDVDGRTDVWAAGATLFTLLTGRTVHEGGTAAEVVRKAAQDPAHSLAKVAPKVPSAIAEVVDCALAFERDSRWASAEEMRTALLAAFRLHFGRAPSRANVAALLDAPASGIARRRVDLEPAPSKGWYELSRTEAARQEPFANDETEQLRGYSADAFGGAWKLPSAFFTAGLRGRRGGHSFGDPYGATSASWTRCATSGSSR